MSIVAYVGLPGSGKSYSVVEQQILPAVQAGRTVVTNIPLIPDAWASLGLPGKIEQFDDAVLRADPARLADYIRPGVVFVWDEVQLCLPQGWRAEDVPDVWKELFSKHRHMADASGNSTQIVFVTQDLANVAKFARSLIEDIFVTTKLTAVGMSKAFRVDVHQGPPTGRPFLPNRALRQIMGRYRKEIYSLYRSHTLSEASALGANEAKLDQRASIWRRPVFFVGGPACLVLVVWSLHAFSANFHGFAMKAAPASRETPVAAAASAQRSGADAPPSAVRTVRDGLVASVPRVLLVIEGADGAGPERAFLAVEGRVLELGARGVCRRAGIEWQCLYRDSFYDSVGLVESGPRAPVGSYASGVDGRPEAPVVANLGVRSQVRR